MLWLALASALVGTKESHNLRNDDLPDAPSARGVDPGTGDPAEDSDAGRELQRIEGEMKQQQESLSSDEAWRDELPSTIEFARDFQKYADDQMQGQQGHYTDEEPPPYDALRASSSMVEQRRQQHKPTIEQMTKAHGHPTNELEKQHMYWERRQQFAPKASHRPTVEELTHTSVGDRLANIEQALLHPRPSVEDLTHPRIERGPPAGWRAHPQRREERSERPFPHSLHERRAVVVQPDGQLEQPQQPHEDPKEAAESAHGRYSHLLSELSAMQGSITKTMGNVESIAKGKGVPSSFLQAPRDDGFAKVEAKLKALQEKIKADTAKFQAEAAPSSFLEAAEQPDDGFAKVAAKLKALQDKIKADTAKFEAEAKAAPTSLLQAASSESPNDGFAKVEAKLQALQAKIKADQAKFEQHVQATPTSFLQRLGGNPYDGFQNMELKLKLLEGKVVEEAQQFDQSAEKGAPSELGTAPSGEWATGITKPNIEWPSLINATREAEMMKMMEAKDPILKEAEQEQQLSSGAISGQDRENNLKLKYGITSSEMTKDDPMDASVKDQMERLQKAMPDIKGGQPSAEEVQQMMHSVMGAAPSSFAELHPKKPLIHDVSLHPHGPDELDIDLNRLDDIRYNIEQNLKDNQDKLREIGDEYPDLASFVQLSAKPSPTLPVEQRKGAPARDPEDTKWALPEPGQEADMSEEEIDNLYEPKTAAIMNSLKADDEEADRLADFDEADEPEKDDKDASSFLEMEDTKDEQYATVEPKLKALEAKIAQDLAKMKEVGQYTEASSLLETNPWQQLRTLLAAREHQTHQVVGTWRDDLAAARKAARGEHLRETSIAPTAVSNAAAIAITPEVLAQNRALLEHGRQLAARVNAERARLLRRQAVDALIQQRALDLARSRTYADQSPQGLDLLLGPLVEAGNQCQRSASGGLVCQEDDAAKVQQAQPKEIQIDLGAVLGAAMQEAAANAMMMVVFSMVREALDYVFWACGAVLVLLAIWLVMPQWEATVQHDEVRPQGSYLPFVSGLSALCTAWVLTGHFANHGVGPTHVLFQHDQIAVQVLIVLAGFMTHHVYGGRPCFHAFYVARMGGIVGCYYATQVLEMLFQHYRVNWQTLKTEVPMVLSLTQAWFPGPAWHFANGPAWIVSLLFAGVIFYPYLAKLCRTSTTKLCILLVLCHVVPLWPAALCRYFGFPIDPGLWKMLYHSPLFRGWEFLGGMVLAEVLARQLVEPGRKWAAAGDVSFVMLVMLAAAVPAHHRTGVVDAAMIVAPMALVSLLILGMSLQPGVVGKLLGGAVAQQLGLVAFQAFLWQGPVAAAFKFFDFSHPNTVQLNFLALMHPHSRQISSTNLVLPYFVAVWTVAAWWALRFDAPLKALCRDKVPGKLVDAPEPERAVLVPSSD